MNLMKDYYDCFVKMLTFIEEYRWLVDFAVTDILVTDVFSKIPSDWLQLFKKMTFEDATVLANCSIKPEWPESLVEFFKQCNSLSIESLISLFDNKWSKYKIDKELCRGLSPKKQCEVESLAGLVDLVCKQSGSSGVIDVGSGLGYVDRLLAVKGYSVLGIESNINLVEKARNQVDKLSSNLSNKITFHPLKLCEESTVSLIKIAQSFAEKNNLRNGLCVVGLHTCGDLTSSALKTFLKTPLISSTVLMPCCYHKMSLLDYKTNTTMLCNEDVVYSNFKNFPLSKMLSRLLCKPEHKEIFFRPFLRLASQESNARWKCWSKCDHENNAFKVMSRAVLQLYIGKEGLQLKKRHRRGVNKNSCVNFTSFVKDVMERFDFIDSSSNQVIDRNNATYKNISDNLKPLWNEYKDSLLLIEIVLILQMSMQSLVEAFVLLDVLSFLKENNVENLQVAKLVDNKISPRYIALIASKVRL
ncbi:methyltransferase-like protein 25B [Lycorma delicatula]|uniref:methyltransferase-like protein 25B n=1 Tax=Lycorma delicatula TaxID=130591 RepID=UPI003F50F54E